MIRNLVIAIEPTFHGLDDFIDIAERVRKLSDGISVHIISSRDVWSVQDPRWQNPTLVVGLSRPQNFELKRGRIFTNRSSEKLDDNSELFKSGLGPPAKRFRFGMKLNPADWGPFTILKQLVHVPSTNKTFKLLRTHRVPLLTPADVEAMNFPTKELMVQPFLDTGAHPNAFRVLTFFGKCISATRQTISVERPSLDAATSDEDLAAAFIAIIESGVPGRPGLAVSSLDVDMDVIALAEKAARLWPLHPTFGVDIVRDTAGKLHVLEMNGGGNTWHFSSQLAAKGVRASLSRKELLEQFNAFDIVAAKLVELTLRHAR